MTTIRQDDLVESTLVLHARMAASAESDARALTAGGGGAAVSVRTRPSRGLFPGLSWPRLAKPRAPQGVVTTEPTGTVTWDPPPGTANS